MQFDAQLFHEAPLHPFRYRYLSDRFFFVPKVSTVAAACKVWYSINSSIVIYTTDQEYIWTPTTLPRNAPMMKLSPRK